MTNRNKKILDDYQKRQFKKKKYIFHERIFLEFATSFLIIGISIFFLLFSIINISTFYSMILAIFSTLVTLSFEITEWIKYIVKKDIKKSVLLNQILNYNTFTLLISIIILVLIMIGFHVIKRKIPNLFENIPVSLPNIITTITLSIYFVSYSVRCLVKECCDFRKNMESIIRKPCNVSRRV